MANVMETSSPKGMAHSAIGESVPEGQAAIRRSGGIVLGTAGSHALHPDRRCGVHGYRCQRLREGDGTEV